MKNFNNKTVIITGASAGLGEAAARMFAQHKANIVLLARGEEALKKLEQELSAQTKVMSVAMDVCDSQACRSMLEKVKAEFGNIHVLINNAGLHTRGNVGTHDPIKFVKMVSVNLAAPIELSGLVLPYLREAGEGAIVNVSSLAGRAPMQGAATYSSTKAGLRAFTYALHDELRNENIEVGLVSPGPVTTGFILDEIDLVEDIVFSQPMSTPEEVAEAILKVARGEKVEISLTRASGWLTMIAYLFPGLRRVSRPFLYAKGRRAKAKYRSKAS